MAEGGKKYIREGTLAARERTEKARKKGVRPGTANQQKAVDTAKRAYQKAVRGGDPEEIRQARETLNQAIAKQRGVDLGGFRSAARQRYTARLAAQSGAGTFVTSAGTRLKFNKGPGGRAVGRAGTALAANPTKIPGRLTALTGRGTIAESRGVVKSKSRKGVPSVKSMRANPAKYRLSKAASKAVKKAAPAAQSVKAATKKAAPKKAAKKKAGRRKAK